MFDEHHINHDSLFCVYALTPREPLISKSDVLVTLCPPSQAQCWEVAAGRPDGGTDPPFTRGGAVVALQ